MSSADRVNILVVDDHAENRLALSGILDEPDYNIVMAANGAEALVQVLRHDFAVILLDVMLPDFDGFEVASMLRDRPRSRHVPIIFLTATGENASFQSKGYSVGAVDYLTKPIRAEILAAKVAVFADLFRMGRQVARQAELLRETERREAERQFRVLFDAANDAVLISDDERRYVDANTAACNLLGVSREQLLGKRIDDFVDGQATEAVPAMWQKFMARGELAGEMRLYRADGRPLDLEFRANANFVPGRHLSILRDITERKRTEIGQRLLSDAGAVLGSSLDFGAGLKQLATLAVGAFADACLVDVIDTDGPRCIAAAHARPAVAKGLAEFHSERLSSSTGFGNAVRRVIDRRETESFRAPESEIFPPRSDTEPRFGADGFVSAVIAPITVRGRSYGAIVFLMYEALHRRPFDRADVAVADEIARRAAMAIDNARLYEGAQEAIRARDEFISIASHELRTPLTSLLLQVQALRRASASEAASDRGARALDKLDSVERSALRLNRLVSDLLDVARVMGGRIDLHAEEIDLVAVVRDAAARLADDLQRTSSTLAFSGEGIVVGSWDRLRLDEVATNLISNAIKYGGGKPIEVSTVIVDGVARLSVRDHGIGIAPEHQARIFERFERAVSAHHYGGFGLGLWIVRQFVEAMGGRIRVESKPGDGSTFIVELPLRAAEVTGEQSAAAPAPPE